MAVGDALGVPVEFTSREELARNPVRGLRANGTHSQPLGTWSDDTSLTLCTAETLIHHGDNTKALAKSFVRWLDDGHWTPHGEVFDVGGTTRAAIRRLSRGTDPLLAGGAGEQENGNGSLMRILPVALWCSERGASAMLKVAHNVSALTHRHPRNLVACGIYCLVARQLMAGERPGDAINNAWAAAKRHQRNPPYRSALSHFQGVASQALSKKLPRDIKGSGYVVESLEASLWCLLTSGSFEESVLKAVNLGDDADTTGAITGGLAGLAYGVQGIPQAWREGLARHRDLAVLFEAFIEKLK